MWLNDYALFWSQSCCNMPGKYSDASIQYIGIIACSVNKIMFILTEAAGNLADTLILLPTHSSANNLSKSDKTRSSKNTEKFSKISKKWNPFLLFIPVFVYFSSSMRGGLRDVVFGFLGACQVMTSPYHNFDIGEWVLKRWTSHSPVKGWPLLFSASALGSLGRQAAGRVPSTHQHPDSLLRCRNMQSSRCAWAQPAQCALLRGRMCTLLTQQWLMRD